MAASTLRLPKKRQTFDDLPLSRSEADLTLSSSTLRRSGMAGNPSVASLYASTLTPPGSRSASPAGRISSARMSPGGAPSAAAAGAAGVFGRSLLESSDAAATPGDPLSLVLKAFVPHVAVYASEDTDALVREKGFRHGLWELLRPFGELVQGKVTIRDSVGAAKTWDDFSIRFVRLGENVERQPSEQQPQPGRASSAAMAVSVASTTNGSFSDWPDGITAREARRLAEAEEVVDRHLRFAERSLFSLAQPGTPTKQGGLDAAGPATSPYYSLYLRRLLSGIPVSPHETFAHPVACVVAISSRSASPIEALRSLYRETSEGEGRLPDWVSPDYLRYYVLVHDEEDGDVAKSMALFEQMKRNFGLHCHLLRIRSSRGAETDDDSLPLPRPEWMPASEELADIRRHEEGGGDGDGDGDGLVGGGGDFEAGDPTQRYIFESDATAIRTFVREMVLQSVIPTMERNVSLWNDQVASKRKGIGGRFMSMSRRWAGFGSSSKAASSGSNYVAAGGGGGGFYRADSPEAVLRRLADHAFALRDWRLAHSTYSLLRADFENDHAWRHHAAANEMAALSLLIMAQTKSQGQAKTLDAVNDMLRDGSYSYHTRCAAPYGTLRCSVLGMELLRLRGGPAIESAVRLGMRLMESNNSSSNADIQQQQSTPPALPLQQQQQQPRLVGAVGDALLRERMAVCCASKTGFGSQAWGSWRRKSALWSVLAVEAWLRQGKFLQAQRCLNEARVMYSMLQSDDGIARFERASEFMAGLNARLKEGMAVVGGGGLDGWERKKGPGMGLGGGDAAVGGDGDDGYGGGGDGRREKEEEEEEDVEVEVLADQESESHSRRRSRRQSLIGGPGVPGGGVSALETAPLRRLSSMEDEGVGKSPRKDDFG